MKKTIFYSVATCLLAVLLVTSCKKKNDSSPADQGSKEFSIFNTWTCKNQDMPTQSQRDNYSSMELTIKQDMSYSWKWVGKNGTNTVFTGYIAQNMSKYNYNGQPIWTISVNVAQINGSPAPGGWAGIYASIDVNSFLLDIEPSVQGTTKFPSPEGGMGSGQSGNNGVYKFTR